MLLLEFDGLRAIIGRENVHISGLNDEKVNREKSLLTGLDENRELVGPGDRTFSGVRTLS